MALQPFTLTDGNTAVEYGFSTATWKLEIDRSHWKCQSERYGSVEYAVTTDAAGMPAWDRPVYREAPHVFAVPWYKPMYGPLEIGLILEERVHGGGPFWGVPRGFLNPGEEADAAALREAGEEAGVRVVKGVHYLGAINPNPTFIATTGPVIALELDKARLMSAAPERTEKIYRVQFFPRQKLNRAILKGEHSGGRFSDGASLAAIYMFLAWHDVEMI